MNSYIILLLALLSSVGAWKGGSVRWIPRWIPSIRERRDRSQPSSLEMSATGFVSLRKTLLPVLTGAAIATSVIPSSFTVEAAEGLKARELIQSDLNEDKVILKNILQVFKLNAGLVDSKDYQSIRTSMRSGSVTSLRKTCKQLCKVLESEEQQQAFNDAYDDMIDKLNDFDTLVTKRLQRTGIPAEDAKDEDLRADLDALVNSFEAMLKVV